MIDLFFKIIGYTISTTMVFALIVFLMIMGSLVYGAVDIYFLQEVT